MKCVDASPVVVLLVGNRSHSKRGWLEAPGTCVDTLYSFFSRYDNCSIFRVMDATEHTLSVELRKLKDAIGVARDPMVVVHYCGHAEATQAVASDFPELHIVTADEQLVAFPFVVQSVAAAVRDSSTARGGAVLATCDACTPSEVSYSPLSKMFARRFAVVAVLHGRCSRPRVPPILRMTAWCV